MKLIGGQLLKIAFTRLFLFPWKLQHNGQSKSVEGRLQHQWDFHARSKGLVPCATWMDWVRYCQLLYRKENLLFSLSHKKVGKLFCMLFPKTSLHLFRERDHFTRFSSLAHSRYYSWKQIFFSQCRRILASYPCTLERWFNHQILALVVILSHRHLTTY